MKFLTSHRDEFQSISGLKPTAVNFKLASMNSEFEISGNCLCNNWLSLSLSPKNVLLPTPSYLCLYISALRLYFSLPTASNKANLDRAQNSLGWLIKDNGRRSTNIACIATAASYGVTPRTMLICDFLHA